MYSHKNRPTLAIKQILKWADSRFAVCGEWPIQTSGGVQGEPYEKWRNIDMALKQGLRGLAPGDSLAKLLQRERGVRNRLASPDLPLDTILAWSDDHYARTGGWPTVTSGDVIGQPYETWAGVNAALKHGRRGLPGGASLFRLLSEKRGVPDRRPPELRRVANG